MNLQQFLILDSDYLALDLDGVGSLHRWRHRVLSLMIPNPVHISLLDESTFYQMLRVTALAVGKVQKDPLSTALEV